MSFTSFLFVPTILFLVIVAPTWVVMHYQSKNRALTGINDEDRHLIDDLVDTIEKLADRVETLEAILDQEQPEWKKERK
jgi:phage shock protein B